MVPPELSFVINHFNREGFTTSSEWIKACVEWCKAEVPNSCRSHQSLIQAVLSQWLDTDLRTEGVQSGPQLRPADFHTDKLKPKPLKGPFILQILG